MRFTADPPEGIISPRVLVTFAVKSDMENFVGIAPERIGTGKPPARLGAGPESIFSGRGGLACFSHGRGVFFFSLRV